MVRRIVISFSLVLLFILPAQAELIESLINYKVKFSTQPRLNLSSDLSQDITRPLYLLKVPLSSLAISYDLDDVYKEKIDGVSTNSLYQKQFDLTSFLPLRSGGRYLGSLGFSARKKTIRANLSIEEEKYKQKVLLHKKESRIHYANRIKRDLSFGLSLGANQYGDYRNIVYAIETEFGLRKFFRAYFLASSDIDYYLDMDIEYQDEKLNFYAPFRTDRYEIELSTNILPKVWLGIKRNYSPGHSQDVALEDIDKYSIQLDRDRHSTEGRLFFDLSRDIKFSLSLAWIEDKWKGKLKSNSTSFSKYRLEMKTKHYAAEILLPRFIRNSPVSFEFSYLSTAADAFARLQTWPFTPIIIDLLGNRHYFDGSGQIEVYNIVTKSQWAISKRYLLGAQIDFMNLRTDGVFSTWQPVWMGMGKMNLEAGQMKLKQANILYFSLNNHFKLNSHFFFNLLLNQYVPLSTKKEKVESEGEAPPSGEDPAPAKSKSVWGGTSFKISLRYNI